MLDFTGVNNFGDVDADEDELLAQCFQDHEAFRRARDNDAFLITGRKGSGKTAIFRRLRYGQGAERLAFGYSFEDYPWEHHDLQAGTGVPEPRRYTHSWKYLMLMAVTRLILRQDRPQPWRAEAKADIDALRAFVRDSYGTEDLDITHLFQPHRELRFSGGIGGPIGRVDISRIPIPELPKQIQLVNAVVQQHVMNALNPHRAYYVCFDQLDIGFSTADETDTRRLIGLILAARELFRASKEAGKRLNVVVFLRDDIYRGLRFEDKNKITEGRMAEVKWAEDGDGLTLRGLMESRFGALMTGPDSTMEWRRVFNEEEPIDRQTKYRYICDRTFLRPRDMIKYCNEVLTSHRFLKRPPNQPFGRDAVAAAGRRYSDYLRKELEDEVIRHVPGYDEYLKVIRATGSDLFQYQDFAEAWAAAKNRRSHRDNDPSVLDRIDPQSALEQLFEFSVIGYQTQTKRNKMIQNVWRYQDPDAILNLDALSLRVHPGLIHALHLKD